MARAFLRVPKSQAEPLARLLKLPESDASSLERALSDAKPSLSLKRLSDEVAGAAGLTPEATYELIRVLAMLYTTRDRAGAGLSEFLADVERAARETDRDDLQSPAIGWDRAKQRLERLLKLDGSLGVTAKALDVLTEHEKVFCDARVLTDVRPIFAADVEHSPDAFILVHKLRIAYHQDGALETTYIAMDASDVETLLAVLKRASSKEKSLESLAEKSGLPVLRAKSHAD